MEIKVIRTAAEYKKLLTEAERIVGLNPLAGSQDADRLELMALLIEDYEKRVFPFDTPDPIDAIEFRMQEQGLRQVDLVPMLGSRSRVSEVLARKRPLTVQMIRSISAGLGIPVDILVAERPVKPTLALSDRTEQDLAWDKFPIQEMQKRGWINLDEDRAKIESSAAASVRAFIESLGERNLESALYRRSFRGEELEEKAYYSTLAWTGRVMARAKEIYASYPKFQASALCEDFFISIARLSSQPDGPLIAIRALAEKGITLIVEPKLPNTLIDGAALMSDCGMPVIGLTLRYDRVDYFWFTLLHELAHVWKHLTCSDEGFIDRVENSSPRQAAEKEANKIARDALIPRAVWKRSAAFLQQTKPAILELASALKIHPAIVVGRIQKETERYEKYRDLLGQGTIRPLFPELKF
jgi:HTH-type transcriptional regulator/antitoxin HigA